MAFNGRYKKGYMRTLRELKREEAEKRNAAYRATQVKPEADTSANTNDNDL